MSREKKPKVADREQLPYRPCAGQMVINREGLVWVGCRVDDTRVSKGLVPAWQMPQGGIDKDEDPRDAAVRELFEETGMRSLTLLAEHPQWITYDLPAALIGTVWGGKYRGQRQKWFAFRFEGDDSEITIEPHAGHDAEFSAWRWVEAQQLIDLVVPFKRDLYRAVLAEFEPLARPLAA